MSVKNCLFNSCSIYSSLQTLLYEFIWATLSQLFLYAALANLKLKFPRHGEGWDQNIILSFSQFWYFYIGNSHLLQEVYGYAIRYPPQILQAEVFLFVWKWLSTTNRAQPAGANHLSCTEFVTVKRGCPGFIFKQISSFPYNLFLYYKNWTYDLCEISYSLRGYSAQEKMSELGLNWTRIFIEIVCNFNMMWKKKKKR